MSRYDFTALSSQDFEELSRDLLQADWNVRLEAFKSGRDKGIDFRHIRAGHGTTIIQRALRKTQCWVLQLTGSRDRAR